jgi:hypothetical protein
MHTGTYPDKIEGLVRCYVMYLKEGGIDPVSYVRHERALHSQQFVDRTFRYVFWPTKVEGDSSASCTTWDLIGSHTAHLQEIGEVGDLNQQISSQENSGT